MNTPQPLPTLLTDELLFAHARTIAKKHYYKWQNPINNIDYDDLEGEVMEWVVIKRKQCVQKFSDEGYYHYMGWLNKCVGQMIARWCQEQLVRGRTFVALGSLDTMQEGSETMQGMDVGLTYYGTVQGLTNGDQRLLKMASQACTDRQYTAIKRVLFDGEKVGVVMVEMGIAYSTVKFHIDRGVHNIVSKAYYM